MGLQAVKIIGPPGYWPPNTHHWPNPLSPPAVLDWRPSIFLRKIIGPPGFEPGTSCTRNKRTTKLCYGPNEMKLYPQLLPPKSLKNSRNIAHRTPIEASTPPTRPSLVPSPSSLQHSSPFPPKPQSLLTASHSTPPRSFPQDSPPPHIAHSA